MMKTILFDLDGTLLPMPSQEEFVKVYFHLLTKVDNYDPKRVIDTLIKGTKAMVQNDGNRTNEEVFWGVYRQELNDLISEDLDDIKAKYEIFYNTEFDKCQSTALANPLARKLIDELRQEGYHLILATNPLFPRVAVEKRLAWIDLKFEDFDFVSTNENMGYCKPNPKYYESILAKNGLNAEEVIMVGNDVNEDIKASAKAGIDSILVTDTIIGSVNDVDVESVEFKDLLNAIHNKS